MALTLEAVGEIAATLKALPPIENQQRQVSKQEAIRLLAKEILASQKRGYSLEQIAEVLQSKGLALSAPTLKNYLPRSRSTKQKDTPRRPAAPVVDTAAPPPLTSSESSS